MKVLFAVNDEKDAEAITRVYQKEYKEIISSKTVYYFNAIIKELQKDKTYDRIVISEDVEMFASDNYQAVDKFIFDKMDAISDEATNAEGNDIPIILLGMDRRTKNDPLLVKLFGLGLYNVLVGQDRSLQKVAALMYKPRTKKEAKAYYKVEAENVGYSSDSKSGGVNESEIQNILAHYKKIGNNIPKCVQSFDSIASQYSDDQVKLIIQVLPNNVKVILEENSDAYRKIMGIKGRKKVGTSELRKAEYVEKEIDTGNRLTQPVIIPTAVGTKKAEKTRAKADELRNKKIEQKTIEEAKAKKVAEEAKKKEERLAKLKAAEEAKRKEEERLAKLKAAEEAKRKEEERLAKLKAAEEAKRKEKERLAKLKVAEEEAKKKEEERLARLKAEKDASMNIEDEDVIVTPKRGRGRPRKNPVAAVVSQEDVPVKRKRGRPRKNPIVEDVIENDIEKTSKIDDDEFDDILAGFDDYENDNTPITVENDIDNQFEDEYDLSDFDIDEFDEDKATEGENDDEFDSINEDTDKIAEEDVEEDIGEDIDMDNDDEIDDDEIEDVIDENEGEKNEELESETEDVDKFDDEFDFDEIDKELEEKENRASESSNEDYDEEDDNEDYDLDWDDDIDEFEEYDDIDDDDIDEDVDESEEYNDLDDDDIDESEEYDDVDDDDIDESEEYDDIDDDENIEDGYDEEDDELPDFDDEDNDGLPGVDGDDELPDFDEEDEELPGLEDEDNELSKVKEDDGLSDFDDDDGLPGFDDEDDELSEFDDDESLPGFDDDYEDDELSEFDDEETEELNDEPIVEETNEIQHNGSFKGINNKNYKYDNDLASSIKDLQETENEESYNLETDNLITAGKKIVSFVGTTKNGTSFIVNNLADLYSNRGIKTAILDLTKNKNSYYIYTNNEDELREKAQNCLEKLKDGVADGVVINKNLDVYTSLPGQDDALDDVTNIIKTLLENYTIVLLDCDFETDVRYFRTSQEMYLVQSLDVLTIQPLTAFLRELKVKDILETNKLRIIINKNIKVNILSEKILIGGMSVYNDPSMTYMTELFNKDTIKYTTIPFENQVYAKYLEGLVNCEISMKGYSKSFITSMNKLADMVYPTINGKKLKENYNDYSGKSKQFEDTFSKDTSSILNKMKKKY